MSLALDPLRPHHVLPFRASKVAVSRNTAQAGTRIVSIDLLRGVVMVLMALDHTRDFFGAGALNPRDLSEPALFLTRWVTHFCAPVFIFLAGVSAFLYGAQGRGNGEVSRFLFSRGLWLVVIEWTVVGFGWTFSIVPSRVVVQVIFAIGVSMIALAVLVHLPRWLIAVIALTMIGGHNMLDGIKAEQFGAAASLWNLLHQPAMLELTPSFKFFVLYPLIPWIGVMAAGYALGPVFRLDRASRMRWLISLGAAVTAGFVVLRATNLYGDPAPWVAHDSLFATALSFINCEKYPPSLLYLAMTLGPALLLLVAFERARGRLADWVATFGKVPLFYYVVHLFALHAAAVLYAWWLAGFEPLLGKPQGYGLGLAGIYAVWLAVVFALYPLCRWFAAVKKRGRAWWWSYL